MPFVLFHLVFMEYHSKSGITSDETKGYDIIKNLRAMLL